MDPNREPELGDLIEIFRKGFQHWAIYVGDGYVIHLVKNPEHGDSGKKSKKPGKDGKVTVKKERLRDVVGIDEYCINNHLDELYEPRPIEDILQEAESFVGSEHTYNVLSSNCEHFVTLLRYGKPQSQQAQQAKSILIAAAVVFGILAISTLRKEDNQDQ